MTKGLFPVEVKKAERITIKKYTNRRLYNAAESVYTTLEDLAKLLRQGTKFNVYDVKSGEDITRSVLIQILVEQEAKANNVLSVTFLETLICFCGDSLQGLVTQYLEMTIDSFARNQSKMRRYLESAVAGDNVFSTFEDLNRENMEMFEHAVNLLSPAKELSSDYVGGPSINSKQAYSLLREKLEEMQKQLEVIASKS